MEDEKNQPGTAAVVEEFNDCANRHDLAGLMARMAEDIVFENTFPPPDGTRYEGRNAVGAFWRDFFESSPGARFEIEELVEAGIRCAVRWRYVWDEGPNAKGYVRGIDLFRVENGKIVEKLSYVKG